MGCSTRMEAEANGREAEESSRRKGPRGNGKERHVGDHSRVEEKSIPQKTKTVTASMKPDNSMCAATQ